MTYLNKVLHSFYAFLNPFKGICFWQSLFICLFANNSSSYAHILMKPLINVDAGARKIRLDSCGEPDHCVDPGIF